MKHSRTALSLGLSFALALATPALVFAENTPDDQDKTSSLAEQVENGDLITTSGNGENTPASGDVGKDAIPDPLAAQESGQTATPDERATTPVDMKSDSDDAQFVDSDYTDRSDSSDNSIVEATNENTDRMNSAVSEASMDTDVASTSVEISTVSPVDLSRDASITSQARTGLASTPAIEVETRNGVISLSGEVASFDEKMRIARAAAMIDGAHQVDVSNLTITTSAIASSEED